MHRFDGPATFNEAQGEVVEQLRMCRRSALFAEIAWRRHDPLAEVEMPDAIHHHSRRQWIGRIRDPVSQFQPAAAFGIRGKNLSAQHRGKSTRYFLTEAFGIALDLHAGVADLLLA